MGVAPDRGVGGAATLVGAPAPWPGRASAADAPPLTWMRQTADRGAGVPMSVEIGLLGQFEVTGRRRPHAGRGLDPAAGRHPGEAPRPHARPPPPPRAGGRPLLARRRRRRGCPQAAQGGPLRPAGHGRRRCRRAARRHRARCSPTPRSSWTRSSSRSGSPGPRRARPGRRARGARPATAASCCPQDPLRDVGRGAPRALRLRHVDLLRLAGRWEDARRARARRRAGARRAHAAAFAAGGTATPRSASSSGSTGPCAASSACDPGPEAMRAARPALASDARASAPDEPSWSAATPELAALERALTEVGGRSRPGDPRDGPPGIGKSALLAPSPPAGAEPGWRVGHGRGGLGGGRLALRAGARRPRRPLPPPPGPARRPRRRLPRAEIDRALAGGEVAWSGDRGTSGCSSPSPSSSVWRRSGRACCSPSTTCTTPTRPASACCTTWPAPRSTTAWRWSCPTARPPSVRPLLDETAPSLLARHGAVEVELAPLDDEATTGLIGRSVAEARRRVVERIAATGRRRALRRGRAGPPGGRRSRRGSSCSTPRMVGGIDPATREVLQRVAVVGADLRHRRVRRPVGPARRPRPSTHLDHALAARLVEPTAVGYRFRHGLVRDALLEDLAPHRRRRIHRDAADRLAELGASPARIGHHLLHAGEPAAAVPHLLRGRRDRGRGARRLPGRPRPRRVGAGPRHRRRPRAGCWPCGPTC